MELEERELPLFPLGAVVLFPEMALPLQVFEERYKQMISDIRKGDSTFGVVLIQEGYEVGESAVPHMVGTTARIQRLGYQDDGRILLESVGDRRFHIQTTSKERPYLVGHVQLLEPEEGTTVSDEFLAQQVGQAYGEYMRALISLQGGWSRTVSTPNDAAMLSYVVGATLQIHPLIKQQLLEAPTPIDRLQAELPLLRQSTVRLKERLQQQNGPGHFSHN
jgi:Lon protease-like protein